MSYLLDTCVLAEYTKPIPDTNVLEWIDRQDEATLFLSVITIAEINKGITKLPSSKRRLALNEFLDSVLIRFGERIRDLDAEVMLRFGILSGELEKKGTPIPVMDGMIAATALVHDLDIVTRNTTDFLHTGNKVLNIWEQK